MASIGFGDNVRVRSIKLTDELGIAGLTGCVYGLTVPSSSGITNVIGDCGDDFAVNVHFEERGESFWFEKNLLEFVDHGAGAEIRLDGVAKKWVRSESGKWVEHDTDDSRPNWWQNFCDWLSHL